MARLAMPGLCCVRQILVLHPKEALGHDQLAQRGAVLVLDDVGELLAEGDEARLVVAARRRHRDRLVGLHWRHRRRLEAAGRQRHLLRLPLREAELGNKRRRHKCGEHQGRGDEEMAHRVGSGLDFGAIDEPQSRQPIWANCDRGAAVRRRRLRPISSRNRRGAARRFLASRQPCRQNRFGHCRACRRDRPVPGISRSARQSGERAAFRETARALRSPP